MAPPTVHVVFDPSGVENLRKALALAGREESVIDLPDHLGFGPIEPLDPEARLEWAMWEFDDFPWIEEIDRYAALWEVALSPDIRPVVWLTKRCTQSYAGMLAYLSRLGDRACEIIDLTDFEVVREDEGKTHRHYPTSICSISPAEIVKAGLLDCGEIPDRAVVAEYRADWARLCAENAPFRIVDAEWRLVSAPIDVFDRQLLSHVTDRWLKAARIAGDTMGAWGEISQTWDFVLAARLHALAESGVIESQGNLFELRYSEVRWPSGA